MSDVFNSRRAALYSQLQWANRQDYIQRFLSFADLVKGQRVLDVGTGTGLLAAKISPLVTEVTGVDNSLEMLKVARTRFPGLKFIFGDVRNLPFRDDSFDRVVSRMVLHHITEGLSQAVTECSRVLRGGGRLVVSEGVPPSHRVRGEYEEVFRWKEKRLTFYPEDLANLLQLAGLANFSTNFFVMRQVSVKNWLSNSGCSLETIKHVMELHLNASDAFKEDYHLRAVKGDCLIDMKFAMVRGEKPVLEGH